MLTKKFDPLKNKMFSILDNEGNVIDEKLEPKISKKDLLETYRLMVLGRTADIKALQYQRQGRMLTYAPNHGQEAAQLGPMLAIKKEDWVVPSFREMNCYLAKGVSLEKIYTYWYGMERGSYYPEERILPINVPIASQLNHATGIALASKLQDKKEVTIGFVGDGGTSEGEFHEALNYAAVFEVPAIFIIQNNGWAISIPRSKQTKAKTLAQKAIGYGMPGIQVDGNDILAMYAVTKEAVDRARKDKGPTLIEAVTYRIGPHTTSDNPKIYREEEEVSEWGEKDPILRLKKYLINKGYWDEEQDKKLFDEINNYVGETFKKVENQQPVQLDEIFTYMYETIPPHLEKQMNDYQNYLKEVEE